MKCCKACKRELEDGAFYRAGKYLMSECKECWKQRVRTRRLTDPSVRQYDRERSKLPHRVQQAMRITADWRAKNPDAYRAHSAVNNAVRDGRLSKKPCQVCGTSTSVHAHHKDYSKPLDVIWLCAKCHHRLHALFPEIEGRNKQSHQGRLGT